MWSGLTKKSEEEDVFEMTRDGRFNDETMELELIIPIRHRGWCCKLHQEMNMFVFP